MKCNIKCTLKICEIHDSLLNYYCFYCKCSICEVCKESFHSEHSYLSKNAIGLNKNFLHVMFKNLENSIQETEAFSNPDKLVKDIKEKIEEELLFFIFRFQEFCFHAANTLRPSVVANYLYDLAKQFNRFYEACPIKGSSEIVKNTRLSLVALTRQTIHDGLKLLGIPSPERM